MLELVVALCFPFVAAAVWLVLAFDRFAKNIGKLWLPRFFRVSIVIGFAVLFAGVLVFWYQRTVDCADGNFLTRLFRDRSVESGGIRDMNNALNSLSKFRDLMAVRVAARQVSLFDKNGRSLQENYVSQKPIPRRPLAALWQSVYVKHHPGVSSSLSTILLIVYDKQPGSWGFTIESRNCMSM